jgi:hypothetical protein
MTKRLNNFYTPSNSNNTSNLAKVKFKKPQKEKNKQMIYLSRIIINIALIFFSPTNPFFLLSASLEIYSLIKIAQRKWCKFSKKIYSFSSPYCSSIKINYFFLIQEDYNRSLQEPSSDSRCTICQENDPKPNVYFCNNHKFHQKCLLEMLEHKSHEFDKNLYRISRQSLKTKTYLNSVYTGSVFSIKYTAVISKSSVPACPNCKKSPEFNIFFIKVKDRVFLKSSTNIVWTDH